MNEKQLARLENEAEHAEDLKSLKLLKELRRTRQALRRYLDSHVDAVQAVGTARNQEAGRRFWRAYYGAWRALGEKPVEVEQLY